MDTDSLLAQIATLQAELDSLRARYDTLLEAKNRAADRYKADYKKWRDFKRWLFRDAEADEHVEPLLKADALAAYTRSSALGKRKLFEEFGPKVEHAGDERENKCFKQEPDCDAKAGLLHSSPVAVPPRHQRRKSYRGESPHKVLLPSPCGNENPFLVSHPNTHDDTSLVLDNNVEMPCKPPHAPPQTEPRKRKGRYAQLPSAMDTINSRFSIRKDRNHGLDFQYDAVVRNREERKHMLGSDCECCREYYEAVGPLPASRQPLWRTPTKRKALCNHNASSNDKENTDEVEHHKQLISRHRHHWHRPKTPPGYWDIGFPDTQEVLDINRRAAEMHKRKLVDVATEAKKGSGRYVERAPRTP